MSVYRWILPGGEGRGGEGRVGMTVIHYCNMT